MDKGLNTAVERFIDTLTPLVEDLAGDVLKRTPKLLRDDVTVEAYNLSVAFIDADGRHTDDELYALVASFGGRLPTHLAFASPDKIRTAGLLTGKRAWLDEPSVLFDILVKADAKGDTEYAKTYYERAMLIAHTVASLDSVTSQAELNAIDHFRTMVLGQINNIEAAKAPKKPVAAKGTGGGPEKDGDTEDDAAGPPRKEDLPPARPVAELLAELDKLVGLEAVKAEVRLVADLLQVQKLRSERGLKVADSSRHLVFTGNPGTGKTTVARLLAEIYRSLEVVELGHLVETDRSALVAGFVGQTATKVVETFDRADQGVLLIDEAYSLVRGGEKDFGREAIDTIVKLVEDRRDRVVVIAAGYPDEMADFIDANPGLKSRFPKTIHFPDYDTDELLKIFNLIADGNAYSLGPGAEDDLAWWLDSQPRTKGFGNGRLARNLFEAMVAEQAGRVVAIDDITDEQLVTLTAEDLPPIDILDPNAVATKPQPEEDEADEDEAAADPGDAESNQAESNQASDQAESDQAAPAAGTDSKSSDSDAADADSSASADSASESSSSVNDEEAD